MNRKEYKKTLRERKVGVPRHGVLLQAAPLAHPGRGPAHNPPTSFAPSPTKLEVGSVGIQTCSRERSRGVEGAPTGQVAGRRRASVAVHQVAEERATHMQLGEQRAHGPLRRVCPDDVLSHALESTCANTQKRGGGGAERWGTLVDELGQQSSGHRADFKVATLALVLPVLACRRWRRRVQKRSRKGRDRAIAAAKRIHCCRRDWAMACRQ